MTNYIKLKQTQGQHSQRSRKLNNHISIVEESNPEEHFNERKVYEYYGQLKEAQHKKLAQCNLSDSLKKKLFGFSAGYYCSNNVDPYKLIIQNHPMKGRIIMKDKKYQEYLNQKYKQRQLKQSDKYVINSQSLKNNGSNSQSPFFSDDLQLPYDNTNKKVISNHLDNPSESQKFIHFQKQ